MEIDAFSIIVAIVAFSFFAIPIAYDQIKNKKKKENEEDKAG